MYVVLFERFILGAKLAALALDDVLDQYFLVAITHTVKINPHVVALGFGVVANGLATDYLAVGEYMPFRGL